MIPAKQQKSSAYDSPAFSGANLRLREYILSKHGSVNAFCKASGIKYPAQMTPYLNGRSMPGRKMLKRLEEDGADIDWILHGKSRETSSEFARKLMISHYRTELENLLRKARYLTDCLNESANASIDAYAILDHELKIERFSHSIEKLLGYPENRLMGRNILELIHHHDRETAEKEIRRNRKAGTVSSFITRILRADGKYVRIEWSLFANEIPMSENIEFTLICRKQDNSRE
jgi:PAS domain S-box-containing protein